MATVLIVGASRGIGLEFVRQYTAEGNRVIATHRKPESGAKLRELGAKPAVLDILDEGAVLDLAKKWRRRKSTSQSSVPGSWALAAKPSHRPGVSTSMR